MGLQLPDWYEGPHYLNLEDVVHDWLADLLPHVQVVHWLRPGWYTPGDGKGTDPTIRIWRMPGNRDEELSSDIALLQVAAITRNRTDSWKLLDFVGDMFQTLNDGFKIPRPDGSRVQLKNVKPWLGPQEIPEGLIDDFFVPMTWTMTSSRQKLTPNYRQILETLPT